MKNNITEEKKIFSFDKSASLNILYAKPDKYKQLEEISRQFDEIINTGSSWSCGIPGCHSSYSLWRAIGIHRCCHPACVSAFAEEHYERASGIF